ncbi:DEKNAAC100036 [Brettanomyces naardenensis]|uniref:DEKNAAC100036 n=1 Tax=Brettanomyces naardenensis TaxID=13370 RepID=A0A448YG15_BRENA|nr:DEKNAAC100036 [Brettanomyces naardenensis]
MLTNSVLWEFLVYIGLLRKIFTLLKMSQVLYPGRTSSSHMVNGSGSMSSSNDSDRYYGVDLSTQTKVKTQYQLAIRQYLNRNFSRAWEIMSPLIDMVLSSHGDRDHYSIDRHLTVKCYKLYLSLLDLILKDVNLESSDNLQYEANFPEYLLSGSQRAEGDRIRDEFMRGLLMNQVGSLYDHDLVSADPELLLMCFIIEFSNGFPLLKLREQMEAYLTYVGLLVGSINPTALQDQRKENVLSFYLMQVMVKMGRADESRDLICRIFVADDARAESYLERLDAAVAKEGEGGEAEKKKKKKEIRKRVKTVKRKTEEDNSLREKIQREKAKRLDAEKQNRVANDNERRVSQPSGPKLSMLTSLQNYVMNSWFNIGRRPLSDLLKPAVLLVFILSLLISLNGLRRQARLRRFLAWFLQRLRDTLTMAFKVTYL